MSGYRRERKVFVLKFEEHPGLMVRVRSISTGALLELGAVADKAKTGDQDAVKGLLSAFAGALVSWNLEEEDGTPVPCTLAALIGEEMDFVVPMVTAWMNNMSGSVVGGELGKESSSGVTSDHRARMEASLTTAS